MSERIFYIDISEPKTKPALNEQRAIRRLNVNIAGLSLMILTNSGLLIGSFFLPQDPGLFLCFGPASAVTLPVLSVALGNNLAEKHRLV